MVRPRIPEPGEWVQMGKYATAFRGVWGKVVKIRRNPPPLGELPPVEGRYPTGGKDETHLYIQAAHSYKGRWLTLNGKYVVIKASPYELDGGLLDDRPVWASGANGSYQRQRNFRV
jgi:hypothetical protein